MVSEVQILFILCHLHIDKHFSDDVQGHLRSLSSIAKIVPFFGFSYLFL